MTLVSKAWFPIHQILKVFIHFDDPEQCDISMKFLFEVCKKTNVCISFGCQAQNVFLDSDSSGYKMYMKKSVPQLEMERYFCEQDFDVYDKYQNMKNEFFQWLNKASPWFNCNNLDVDKYQWLISE